jgi:hypothetical protein
MSTRKFILIAALVTPCVFVLGMATSGWYFYTWVTASTEDALIDRTLVLQYIREGDFKFAENRVESIAWNQIFSIGNRAARGQTPTVRASEAVAYHCDRFKKQQPVLDITLAKQRAYWCECVLTLRCSGSADASAAELKR